MRKQIIISGEVGAGKTTITKYLAKKYNLKVITAGYAFEKVIEEKGGPGWWEKHYQRFNKERMANLEIDKAVDDKIIELTKNGDWIIDGKFQPWLQKVGLKIWVKADVNERARRVSMRSGIKLEEAIKNITDRDEVDKKIAKQLYGFDLGPDTNIFDLILDTTKLIMDEGPKVADEFVSKAWD